MALLLGASAWTESVYTSPGLPPRLKMAFGGENGFAALDVDIDGENFIVTPAEIAAALRREPTKLGD